MYPDEEEPFVNLAIIQFDPIWYNQTNPRIHGRTACIYIFLEIVILAA